MSLITVSALFKLKGGSLITNLEGDEIRVRCEINGKRAEARLGLDLKALRSLDLEFAKVTGCKPVACSPGEVGIGAKYILRKGSGDVQQGFSVVKALADAQEKAEDSYGFLKEVRNLVEITPGQYLEGVEGDVLVCLNERSKMRMARLVEEDEGEWRGLSFYFNVEVEDFKDPMRDFGLVFVEWERAAWIEGVIDETVCEEAVLCSDNIRLFYDLLNESVSSWSVAERNKLFWQKSDTEISAKKMRSVVGVLFKATEDYVPFDELVREALGRIDLWASQEQRREWGIMDDNSFVIAQMIKSRAQFLVRKRHGTVMYVPKPEQYLRNMKGN